MLSLIWNHLLNDDTDATIVIEAIMVKNYSWAIRQVKDSPYDFQLDVHSLKSPFNLIDIDDEHDGDVLLDDTDADTGASLTVSAIRTGSVEGSGHII